MIKIIETPLERYDELYALIKKFAYFHDDACVITTLESMLADKDYFHALCAIDTTTNVMVAYAIYFYSYRTFTGRTLYWEDVFVEEKYRGKGIYRRFLDIIKNEAQKNRCTKVTWQVSDRNPHARAIYEGLGAEIDNENRNCEIFLYKA